MLAMILRLSSFGAEQIFIFFRLSLCLCGKGAETSHINAYRRILNVLCIYTDT